MNTQKVVFIAGREPIYTRNTVILRALKNCGVEVLECTSNSKHYITRYLEIITKFIFLKNNYDIIFVGYFGQPLVPIIRILSKKFIIFDAFLSSYDTLCFDRKLFLPNSILGRFFYYLDRYSCKLSDIVILDTDAHINYFIETFGLSKVRFKKIYMGADDSIFIPVGSDRSNKNFKIFYYSTYHPLHGVEYIIKSAKILEMYKDIEFEIIGDGNEFSKVKELSEDLNLANVKFINRIPLDKFYIELKNHITDADVCLGGHFSQVNKGKRVIAEKTFQFIAMKKPVIVGDNSANRELLEDRKSALFVRHADPEALSTAILMLKENESLRNIIAEGGYKIFKEKCSSKVMEEEIRLILQPFV